MKKRLFNLLKILLCTSLSEEVTGGKEAPQAGVCTHRVPPAAFRLFPAPLREAPGCVAAPGGSRACTPAGYVTSARFFPSGTDLRAHPARGSPSHAGSPPSPPRPPLQLPRLPPPPSTEPTPRSACRDKKPIPAPPSPNPPGAAADKMAAPLHAAA